MTTTPVLTTRSRHDRQIARWLLICCGAVFVMVVIGGITRLTDSGLSITRWQPLSGALPPMGEAAWQHLFALYRETPEYQKINAGMSLAEFQNIFWWEWTHRFWGRLIGVLFAVPFLYFLIRRRVDRPLGWRLAGIFVLGGLQGAIGWWMVQSGLVDRPDVSQYRLAVHLMMALLIFGLMFWEALHLLDGRPKLSVHSLGIVSWGVLALVVVTITAGAFVAGTDAGMFYNEFPKMGPGFIPPDYRDPAMGWWQNAFENRAAIQFHHRMLAIACVFVIVIFARVGLSTPLPKPAWRALHALIGMVVLQAALGIATLMLVVPIPLAALHQAGAVGLLSAAIWATYTLNHARMDRIATALAEGQHEPASVLRVGVD